MKRLSFGLKNQRLALVLVFIIEIWVNNYEIDTHNWTKIRRFTEKWERVAMESLFNLEFLSFRQNKSIIILKISFQNLLIYLLK